ncbi:MAG: hypothetical protein ABJA02_11250 [Acidobacteriota bacterium]
MWSIALWMIGFFVILMVICLAVYIGVVRAFYWGDKKEPPKKK